MFKRKKHFLITFVFLITVISLNTVSNKVLSDKQHVLKIEDIVKLFKTKDYEKAYPMESIWFVLIVIRQYHIPTQKVENEPEKDGDKVLKVRLGIGHMVNDQKLKQEEKNMLYKE